MNRAKLDLDRRFAMYVLCDPPDKFEVGMMAVVRTGHFAMLLIPLARHNDTMFVERWIVQEGAMLPSVGTMRVRPAELSLTLAWAGVIPEADVFFMKEKTDDVQSRRCNHD